MGRVIAERIFIRPFSDVPGIVEVVGIGRFRRPRGHANEAEMEVLLAAGMRTYAAIPDDDVHMRWIGCGQIDLVPVGSTWQEGRRVDARLIDGYQGVLVNLPTPEAIGVGANPQIKPENLPMPTARIRGARGFACRLVEPEGFTRDPPRMMLLPYTELVRAVFGVSSRTMVQLIDGFRHGPLASGRRLFDPIRSVALGNGRVRLHCDRRLTKREAVLAAMLVCNPLMRRFHDLVFQLLSVDPAWDRYNPAWLEVIWPFSAGIRCGFEGRWFDRDDQPSRFLVTRITRIDLPVEFDVIEMHRPAAPGTELHLPFEASRLKSGRGAVFELVTGRAASGSWRSASLSTPDVEMINLDGVKVVDMPEGGTGTRRAGDIMRDADEDTVHSTEIPAAGGEAVVRPVEVIRVPGEPAVFRTVQQALDKTWEAIRLLAMTNDWDVVPHPSFPPKGPTAPAFDFRTDILFASIATPDGDVLVVDFGSSSGDNRSMGLLIPENYGVNPAEIAAVRRFAKAIDGRWHARGLKLKGFRIVGVSRNAEVWADAEIYAELLSRRIEDALDPS